MKSMKRNVFVMSNGIFELNKNTTINFAYVNKETSFFFNAGSGLFILFSVFSLFILISSLLLSVSGLDINILPVAVTIILSAATGVTVLILSHVAEMIIELRHNGE